jgi:PAS domain-containing protein
VYRLYGLDSATYDLSSLSQIIAFFAPLDRDIIFNAFQQAVELGTPYDARGRHLWVRTIGKVQRLDGQIVRIVGSIQDIRQYKTAQEDLRDSEKKFATLFNEAPLPASLLSMRDQTFVDVNDAWLNLLG